MRGGRQSRPRGYIRKAWCENAGSPDLMIAEDDQYMVAEDGTQLTIE